MKRVFLLQLLALMAIPVSGQTTALDAYLENLYENHFIPGFSVVVVLDGEVVYKKGFGLEYIGRKEPMTAQSSTAVGSLAKSFTSRAVLQLAEQGKLALDTPVVSYLPWFRTANKEMSDRITVRMLLNNTSGLHAPVVRNRDNSEHAAESLVRSLNSVHLTRRPGESYAYSNEGFVLAGLLVEELSGLSYPEYMRQEVFAPLEMPATTQDPGRFTSIGTLYGHYGGIHEAIPVYEEDDYLQEYAAAGSLMRSSAWEMGHYLLALLNGGRYKDQQLISPEGIREMWAPYTSFPGIRVEDGGEGLPFSYGLGWFLGEMDGKEYVFHGGNRRNMSSMTFICPEQKVAAAFLANVDLTFVDRYHYPNLVNILNNIIRIALGEEVSEFALPLGTDPTNNAFQLPEENLEAYLGDYRLSEGSDWIYLDSRLSVKEEENGLVGEITRGDQVLERFAIDFLTPKTAVSRNLNMAQEIQFGFMHSGAVSDLYISGKKYSRISEDYLSQFQEVVSPDGHIRFHVPRSFHLRWEGSSFEGPNQAETRMQGRVIEDFTSLDSVFSEFLPDHEIRYRGLELTELAGSRYWISKAFKSSRQDQSYSHYLTLIQREHRAYALLLSTRGNLSHAVSKLIPAFRENFSW